MADPLICQPDITRTNDARPYALFANGSPVLRLMIPPMLRYRPAPPLDSFVEWIWWSRRDAPRDGLEHVLPSGAAQLVFLLHDRPISLWSDCGSGRKQTWSGALVHGPQQAYYVCGEKPCGAAVGVSFRPGAAAAVLGVAMSELVNRHQPLDALWGTRGVALRERLMEAGEPMRIFRILERELTARIRRSLLMHPAVADALITRASAAGDVRVGELQRRSGCSPRHFIQLFHTAVGMTPLRYFRIQRFNAVLERMAGHTGMELVDIAACAGYADQAHLAREFREFAGVSPTRYRPANPASPRHHLSASRPPR